MGDRPLAHIEKVVSTYAIEGADNIEMTQILDFHVVTKKSEHAEVGDLVVYVEVDSILPDGLDAKLSVELKALRKQLDKATGENIETIKAQIEAIVSQNTRPEFEFLRQKKFRIKAVKYLSKVISQGIIFPLSILPEGITPSEGLDVTEALGIVKVIEDAEESNTTEVESNVIKSPLEVFLDKKFMRYAFYRKLKHAYKGEENKGVWPTWGPCKSDEENAQKIYSKLLEKYGTTGGGWYVSEKLEGQSMAAYRRATPRLFGLAQNVRFAVCSRSRNIITDDGSRFWQTAKELNLEDRLNAIGKNLFIRGEHCGGKIQGNIYKFPDHRLYLYEVFDIDSQKLLNYYEYLEFCNRYNFDHCPIIDGDFSLLPTVQEMLEYSNGMSVYGGGDVMREGLVFRRKDDPSVSFKVRSPQYLIHHHK